MPTRPISALLVGALLVASSLVVVLTRRQVTLNRAYLELKAKAGLPYRGYALPTFRAETLAGDSVTVGALADTAARRLVFVFTTTCPYCRATLPVWAAVADSARATQPNVAVVGLGLDSLRGVRGYAAEHSLTYPVATFPDWKTAQLPRGPAVPQTLVLNHWGEVVIAHIGRLEPGPVLDSVHAAIRGDFGAWDPPPADTAAGRPRPRTTTSAGVRP
jgi:thiol-disulfide isomerase/thioredoxin